MKTKYKITIIALLMVVGSLNSGNSFAQMIEILHVDRGEVVLEQHEGPCVHPEFYSRLRSEISDNVQRLNAEGKFISLMGGGFTQKYEWPLTHETHFLGNDFYFTTNFIDHDTVSGSISDYNCGTRSYDLINGYDHRGTDIVIGPYWWRMMDEMKVRVIAAAPGQIIGRDDGNFDRNCAIGSPGNPNFISVQHADGTVALYLHMKNGSVTTKQVGDFVTTGEFLGYVASSGSSTRPHLHFEIQDSLGNWIDPWVGPCNPDVFQSLWVNQKPYFNSGIMSILTMFDVPSAPACPGAETTPISNHFDQGAYIRVEIHLRDLVPGTTSLTRIYNPSGTQIVSFTDTVNNFSPGDWFSLSFNLPNNLGTYKVEVQYEGKTAAHYFTVGCPPAYNLSGPKSGYKGYITGSNITTTQTIAGSSANNIWYEAGTFIQANPGFRATRGCSFRARIDACAENIPMAKVVDDETYSFKIQANPSIVTDQTKLSLALQHSEPVSISVYDLTGRKVKSVISNQQMESGKHEFELTTAGFTPGIYICSAIAGELKSNCKIIVQR